MNVVKKFCVFKNYLSTFEFRETYSKQPVGVKNFCYNRYMSIRASLFRLCSQRYLVYIIVVVLFFLSNVKKVCNL